MAKRAHSEVIAAFEASGLTQAEFCRQERISPSVLQYHLKKRATGAPRFVSVGGTGALEIETSHGVKIRVPLSAEASVLAKILEAVSARA